MGWKISINVIMEQYLDKLVRWLRIEMGLFFLLILAVVVLGMTGVIPNGIFVGKVFVKTTYIINVVAIALALVGTAVAVKLFNLNTENNLRRYTLDDACKAYRVWSFVRLTILFIAVAFGLVAYFLTLDNIGLFCALMVIAVTIVYCIPSKEKIKNYLEKAKQDKE